MSLDQLIAAAGARVREARAPRIQLSIPRTTAPAPTPAPAPAPAPTPAPVIAPPPAPTPLDRSTRVSLFQDLFEVFGIPAPIIGAKLLYKDPWTGRSRRVPITELQFDILAERVATKIAGPRPRTRSRAAASRRDPLEEFRRKRALRIISARGVTVEDIIVSQMIVGRVSSREESELGHKDIITLDISRLQRLFVNSAGYYTPIVYKAFLVLMREILQKQTLRRFSVRVNLKFAYLFDEDEMAQNLAPGELTKIMTTSEEGLKGQNQWISPTRTFQLTTAEGIETLMQNMAERLRDIFEKMASRDSRYDDSRFPFAPLVVEAQVVPTVSRKYEPLPDKLANPKYLIVNPRNDDNDCFKWASLVHFCDIPHPERVSVLRRFQDALVVPEGFNGTGVCSGDIDLWEAANPQICWSVYGVEAEDNDFSIWLIRAPAPSTYRNRKHHITLIECDFHYSYARDINRLFKCTNVCPLCLKRFHNNTTIAECNAQLDEHIKKCNGRKQTGDYDEHDVARVPTPRKNETKIYMDDSSKKYKETIKQVFYADFEATNDQVSEGYFKHTPRSYQIRAKGVVNRVITRECESGVAVQFVKDILELEKEVLPIIHKYSKKEIKEFPISIRREYKQASICHLCDGEFTTELIKCLDHDQCTGEYLGAAHEKCIKQKHTASRIPCLFHNSNYDLQFIWEAMRDPELQEYLKTNKVRVESIPINTEKSKTLQFSKVVILDNAAFTAGSLDGLLKKVVDSNDESLMTPLRDVAQWWASKKNLDPKIVYEIGCKRKGVFAYEYNWWGNMDEKIPLDDTFKAVFSTRLRNVMRIDDEIVDKNKESQALNESWVRMQELHDHLAINTWRDLHDFYLSVDVAALEVVAESNRKFIIEKFEIDPLHFMGYPGVALAIANKLRPCRVELLPDTECYDWVQRSIRGGFSTAKHPTAERGDTEDGFVGVGYDDANSLYPTVMCMRLPTGNYHWMDPAEFDVDNKMWGTLPQGPEDVHDCDRWQTSHGAFVEVDLHFPVEVHDKLREFTPAPETLAVPDEWLSSLQKEYRKTRCPKLVAHLYDRKNYICHVSNLKLYKELGVIITKVHRVLRFTQQAFMKPYVQRFQQLRAQADAEGHKFQVQLWKDYMNASYGKLVENVFGRMKAYFANNRKQMTKYALTGRVCEITSLGNSLACVYMAPSEVILNKPISAGSSVLELSKLWMMTYWYRGLAPVFGIENLKLHMSDTDSVMYSARAKSETDYQTKIRKIGLKWFDYSGYNSKHQYYDTTRRKQFGFFSDETNGDPINQLVALKAKTYCYTTVDGKQSGRNKGTPSEVRKELTFDQYKDVLLRQRQINIQYWKIGSKKHINGLSSCTRVALRFGDDKSYLVGDQAWPHGHYAIRTK